ncbi:MAG: ribosome maturation factor RimM [Caulobacterales bacterium]
MADRLILVGRVAGAFGVKGEVRITSYSDDPMALVRYRDLRGVDGAPALTLTGGRPAKGALIGRAREVETREAAQALRGLELYIPRALLPPPEGEDEFYLTDLVGLEARAPDGTRLGVVKSVQNFGAGDLLEIAPDAGPTWWLAFTAENAPDVKIAEGWLTAVRPAEAE